MTQPNMTIDPLVRLSNIHVSFDGCDVLCGVDLELSAGVLTVIAGPNGAGKSTLLEVVAGTREQRMGDRSISGAIAFVPQRAAISERLPVTVRDVVSVGVWGRLGWWRRVDAEARELIEDSMRRLGIEGLAATPFAALSGGQQQRALLAQGLARRADVLLLDEPTTGLDAESALRIRSVLREEVSRGVAIACVSHDAALLGDADRTVRLREGRIISELDPS
ncbi:zinc ABC transporter ATP-binding protein AztA [Microbacterium sp.]|uniref:zinc ABC transporter ATP-binding protein AztA n=1 Tax=Microbacterium sp. TaxID=51671 RepID=UPI00289A3436|nr:zinc ABC transporter ATP-binding protein AztA [Microbacterium sp.]